MINVSVVGDRGHGAGFPHLLDVYLEVCTSKSAATSSLRHLIQNHGGPAILDCAVGTGFAVIDLLKEAKGFVCSDGSPDMLAQFRANAVEVGVPNVPLHLNWQELGNVFPAMYDLVICRGNSLAYDSSWVMDTEPGTLADIQASLRGMYGCLQPGGRLYVDYPDVSSELAVEQSFNGHYRGQSVQIHETIETGPGGVRRWTVRLRIGKDSHGFVRKSRALPRPVLAQLLLLAGFERVTEVHEMAKIRDHYGALLAVKGANAE